MTNPEKILNYLSITRKGEWVMEGLIRGIDTEWGFIGFRGDRDVRQLVKDGKLDAEMRGKFRVVRAKMRIEDIVSRINAIQPFAPKKQQKESKDPVEPNQRLL